jgi:uncharacterized protein
MTHFSYCRAPWFVIAALCAFLTGCGPSTQFYRDVEADLGAGRYDQAINGVVSHRAAYGDKSTVLYNMDLGLLYHYAGMSDSSTVHLLAAEQEIEELYTKSITLGALSFVLNDNILPYDGEDFERVMLNVFLALNFAEKGLQDEALVEARKVDLKMRAFAQKYEGKNTYQEDALARYLAGALYESSGEINDAFISYRKAYDAYETYAKLFATKVPPFLLNDLVRTAGKLGFTDEADKFRALGGSDGATTSTGTGSLLLVTYAGKSPIKTEIHSNVSVADTAGIIHTFQIALPKFTPRMVGTRSYSIDVLKASDSTLAAADRTHLAENITAIASQSLDDRLALVYLKSGGRAVLKFLAAEKAKEKIREKNENALVNILSSLAIDLAVGATESADVRSWRTLPAQVQLSRIELPPGPYVVSITSSDGGFKIASLPATVRPGRVTFVIADDIR